MSQTAPNASNFIASHPRLLGALFMMLVLLTKAGAAAGGGSAQLAGP